MPIIYNPNFLNTPIFFGGGGGGTPGVASDQKVV